MPSQSRQKQFFLFSNSLSVRIVVATMIIIVFTALPLYLVVLNAVNDFADQSIRKDLDDLSRSVFNIIDRGYMELLQNGTAGDPIREKIAQVDCLDRIEQFVTGRNVKAAVYRSKGAVSLLDNGIPEKALLIRSSIEGHGLITFNDGGSTYYGQQVCYSPWGLDVFLVKDSQVYAELLRKVRTVYLTYGLIWVVGLFFLVSYLIKSIKVPMNAIVRPVTRGEYPHYKGIREFEFLSDSIRGMMQLLQQAKGEAEQMNTKLVKAGAELEALLDNSPVGIIFLDLGWTIQRVNQELLMISGYTQEELLGRDISIFHTSAKKINCWKEECAVLLETSGCEREFELARKDGTLVWCHVRGRRVDQKDGSEGFVIAIEDIHNRRQMERELLKVQKLESLGVLAGGIAHDFNNLLGVVLGNITLAMRQVSEDEDIYCLLSNSEQATVRAGTLTQKLLTFSSGGTPVKEFASIAEIIMESARFVLHGSSVSCDYDFPDDLFGVEVDKGQMSQVIQNLVINSCQAMADGGCLNISGRNICNSGGDGGAPQCSVELVVADTGPGIDEDDLVRIFDPYFSTKKKGAAQGSGLGLSIVHSIILQHGGSITVQSPPGEGARFVIRLPARKDVVAKKEADSLVQETVSPYFPIHQKGRILIMDDELLVRKMLGSMLGNIGYEVTMSTDGVEAVGFYRLNKERGMPFDVVIMDLTVPGKMGGEKAIRALLEYDAGARVIVSSGYWKSPVMADYETYGFKACVPKPYDIDILSETVREVMAGN